MRCDSLNTRQSCGTAPQSMILSRYAELASCLTVHFVQPLCGLVRCQLMPSLHLVCVTGLCQSTFLFTTAQQD